MRRAVFLTVAGALALSCGPASAPEAPIGGMRLLDPDLVLSELQGSLHLRVFAKGSFRCDAARGHVLDASGARVLRGPSVDPVTPAARCAQGFAPTAANTASPVDLCVPRDRASTVNLPTAGTYIVLVHGQGDFTLPNGTTVGGTLGAGCTEVTLAAGQQQSVTVGVHRQVPIGMCGDGTVDFDETCDLGAAMNNGTSGCSARCQTTEFAVNTSPAGRQQHAAAVWAQGQRLIVAWDNTATAGSTGVLEDVIARYFTADGRPETSPAVLANEIQLGTGPNVQSAPRLAAAASGYVAAWETYEQRSSDIAAQAFGYGIPQAGRVILTTQMATQLSRSPGLAANGSRVVAAWQSQEGAVRGVKVVAVPLAPFAAPSAPPVSLADGDATGVRVAATASGFVVVWSASGDIFARRLDAMGAPLGTSVRVNPVASEAQDQPSVAALPDGSAVVAWRDAARDTLDGDGTSIRWVRLGADGTPDPTLRIANTTVAGDQARPSVAVVPSAGGAMPAVLIAWEDASGSIRARLVHPDGSEVISRVSGAATDFQVNTSDTGVRHEPVAVGGGPGGSTFAVAWEGPDSDTSGIFARIFPL